MTRAPRSLLLGWGSARPSQLVAYERLHRALGLEASSVTLDTIAALKRAREPARALQPVAEDLAREEGARPIVVHLFSDNGFIAWAALLDALASSDAGRRARAAIRAVIVDSAPGLWAVRGPVDFAQRFALGVTPALSRAAGLGPRERLPYVTSLLAAGFVAYQLFARGPVRTIRSTGTRVAANQPRCPHLFLYGDEDLLVPPRDIRAWIARERESGLDVEDHAFAGAKHVALYPKDPRRYRETIRAFVGRALTSP